ncbi:MAG: class I SAM-dependent methyltransferase, partial [Candidatus Hydrogenedentes bacterium]|nr:class I SAM-dependent methyltransferase [Candidatus Hydrogenedentota bacterium]
MPVSTSVHISHCLTYIINLNPRSVLDVGCGFGMWGFLSRMYLDVYQGRVQPDQWTTRIDRLELFEPYIQEHHRTLYSSIQIGDIRDLAPELDTYDLIIAGDVIEHLEKDEGDEVLDLLYDRAEKALLVNIPMGEGWEHPEQYGNPGELHRSQWAVEDFLRFPSIHKEFQLPCGKYGSFYCPKDCDSHARLNGIGARRATLRAGWAPR